MSESVRYITNEQGEQVGVLLNLEMYHQLTNLLTDSEILNGLSHDELQALTNGMLSPKAQEQLNDLLTRNAENQLSGDELATLDNLLAQVDQLNILKTRAIYTLNYLEKIENGASICIPVELQRRIRDRFVN